MAGNWPISLPLKFQAPTEKKYKNHAQNKEQGLETKSDWFATELKFGQNTSEIQDVFTTVGV